MCFVLSHAVQSFQRFIESVERSNCFVYIDDALVALTIEEDHLKDQR